MEKSERCDNLIKLLKESESAYYCKFCKRHLPVVEGVIIHDQVYHDPDYIYENEGHLIQ